MTQFIDEIFFKDLAQMDPGDVCRRASCRYDDVSGGYAMSVWGDTYEILPSLSRVQCAGRSDAAFFDYFALFAVHCLLKAKETDPSGEWISEKDVPGGSAFFRGPHLVPTQMITRRFENNLDAFKARCEERQGCPLDMADAAYGFEITPRVPVAVLYWIGDEDFSAESKVLFDRTVSDHLALDVIYALAVGVCQRMGMP